MFSLLSRAVDFVLGRVLFEYHIPENDDKPETIVPDRYESTIEHLLSHSHRQQDQQDVLLTDLVDLEEKRSDAKEALFTGKVTQVFHGHGLVDGEVYFSADRVVGDKPVQIGDTVNVVARQTNTDGGWVAESVTVVTSTWEDDDREAAPPVPTGDVGKVTQFQAKDGEGLINQNIVFDITVCREGYRPCVGDWVTVEFDLDSSKTKQSTALNSSGDGGEGENGFSALQEPDLVYARHVAPLREWCFEGVISGALNNHGYIDEEVFFHMDACLNGYRPRKWDSVKVGAIESNQGRCNWRAVYIAPTTSDSSAFRNIRNQQRRQFSGREDGFVVPGQRPLMPQRMHNMSIPCKMPQYIVSDRLRQCIIEQNEITQFAPHIAQPLTMDNYVSRMTTLLHLEEIQMELDIQEFSMQRVCLRAAGQFLALEVPGLSEGRPSILIGDAVILSSPVDPEEPRYEGIVHEIHSEEVMLKFNPEFHCRYNGEDYNVKFTFNRTSMRRCHHSVHWAIARLGEEVLFPKEVKLKAPKFQPVVSKSQQKTFATHYVPNINQALQDSVPFYNPGLNDRQKTAVIHILLGQGRPLPYIIFGPPGTGKTITVVEAILQIHTHIPGSRIIACTPSNSAADLLAERLHKSGVIKMGDMVRLNGFNRSPDGIPESILGYCSVGDKLDVLCRYRIIVATCNTAGLLYTANLKTGHFTHAFVDEAGQATEPECLVPCGLMAASDGQIVLAGDPRQLGPVLMSPYAKMFGLELSFLERLMERLPYQHSAQLYGEHEGFHPALVTMLVNNYRSHVSLLSLPSTLFYYGALKPCASPKLTHTLLSWPLLPKPGCPIVFHGVRGEDMREGDSPSWFNASETVQVIMYLQGLLGNNPPVSPDDIGIITPYRKQVEKIRLMIDRLAIPMVKVGSVEEFQGQERQAIIISTVRSNEHLVRSDIRHVLGFLSNPKRFNVAITRAQACLVVIGNPHVLVKDEYWETMLKMCVELGCYTGCQLPDLQTKK